MWVDGLKTHVGQDVFLWNSTTVVDLWVPFRKNPWESSHLPILGVTRTGSKETFTQFLPSWKSVYEESRTSISQECLCYSELFLCSLKSYVQKGVRYERVLERKNDPVEKNCSNIKRPTCGNPVSRKDGHVFVIVRETHNLTSKSRCDSTYPSKFPNRLHPWT